MIDLDDLRIASRARGVGDGELRALWEALAAEGAARAVFYAGGVEDFESFRDFVDAPGRWFYAVHAGGGPAAVFWLDGRSGRSAFVHFAVLRRALGAAARIIGNYVTDWLLAHRGPDGRHTLDVLVGLTPATHVLAVRFVRDIGFTVLGVVPHALPLADGGGTGAVISYLTRKEA